MAGASVPHSVYVLRRIGLLTAVISLLAYPALAFFLYRVMPMNTVTRDQMITSSVLSVAPYGVALAVAALCLSQHLSYRHRAKRDKNTSTGNYLLATTVHVIIWTTITLASIPITTVILYLVGLAIL